MTESGLPRAVTTDQAYLAAILDELKAIRAALSADGHSSNGVVALREPKKRDRRADVHVRSEH